MLWWLHGQQPAAHCSFYRTHRRKRWIYQGLFSAGRCVFMVVKQHPGLVPNWPKEYRPNNISTTQYGFTLICGKWLKSIFGSGVSIIVSQAEVSQKNCRIDILSHPEYKAEHGNTSHLRKHLVKLQIHLTESWTLWHEQHLHLYVILLFFVCTHVRFDQSRWLKIKTITGASGEVKRTSGWHGGESTAPHRKGTDSNRTQQNMWAGAAVWRSYLHTCNMYCI